MNKGEQNSMMNPMYKCILLPRFNNISSLFPNSHYFEVILESCHFIVSSINL